MELLRKKYYDPKSGFISASKLYEKVKSKGVTLKQVEDWLNKQESVQTQKEVRKKEGFKIVGERGDWQADLTFYEQYKGANNGYATILTLIELPSRKAWACKLIRKNKTEMIKAFEVFIKKHYIKRITSDNGSEFIALSKWFQDHQIEQRMNQPGDHHTMGLIERFNRTLRNILEKYFAAYHVHRWIDILDDVIVNYNNTKHSTLGCSPNEFDYSVVDGREHNEQVINNDGVNIGDHVRVALEKGVFVKGAVQKWSTQIYEVSSRVGYSYQLKGVERTYKFYKLQKVNPDEVESIKRNRAAAKDKEIISDTKMIKKIMKELGVGEAEAKRLHEQNK